MTIDYVVKKKAIDFLPLFQGRGRNEICLDDFLLKVMVKQMSKPFDLLLGRITYEIFAAYWPYANTSENPFAARINNRKRTQMLLGIYDKWLFTGEL